MLSHAIKDLNNIKPTKCPIMFEIFSLVWILFNLEGHDVKLYMEDFVFKISLSCIRRKTSSFVLFSAYCSCKCEKNLAINIESTTYTLKSSVLFTGIKYLCTTWISRKLPPGARYFVYNTESVPLFFSAPIVLSGVKKPYNKHRIHI